MFDTLQIDEGFDALGLPPPQPGIINALEAISDDETAIAIIITLPDVQSQVLPVLQMFDLATGHDYLTSATLSSIVSSDLTQPQLADAFVSSPTFANLYNGGGAVDPNAPVTASLVGEMFYVGLGHTPLASTEQGFAGLTNEQAFLAIATSAAMTAAQASDIDLHLTNLLHFEMNAPNEAQIVGQADHVAV